MKTESVEPTATKGIFLVDDHPTLRDGLHRVVDQIPGCFICGEAASASEALLAIPALSPALVITDISLPDRNGLELIKDLRALLPMAGVLVFSMHDEMLYAERSIKAGARGYLMKGANRTRLTEVITRVVNGNTYLSQRVSDHLVKNLAGHRAVRVKLDTLSDRELEVFELIGQCRTGAQIAEQLSISQKTVDAHRGNIKTKLGLADAPSLMREAVLWLELASKTKDPQD
jgi:DNA-binding NarL/FixJ family response regulator